MSPIFAHAHTHALKTSADYSLYVFDYVKYTSSQVV